MQAISELQTAIAVNDLVAKFKTDPDETLLAVTTESEFRDEPYPENIQMAHESLTEWLSDISYSEFSLEYGSLATLVIMKRTAYVWAKLTARKIHAETVSGKPDRGPLPESVEDAAFAAYRKVARLCAVEGEIEVDTNAPVSKGDSDGAYVQAWIWVSNDEAGLSEKSEGE